MVLESVAIADNIVQVYFYKESAKICRSIVYHELKLQIRAFRRQFVHLDWSRSVCWLSYRL